MTPPKSLYTVGGTVKEDSLYLTRRADEELLKLCRDGEFVYILTSRQMGKSSLMVRTAKQLRQAGTIALIIDLNGIGADVTAEEWYFSLLETITDGLVSYGLEPETDLYEWWDNSSHLALAYRFTRFFQEVLLAEISQPIVIFIDEIDTTLSMGSFTDDFFAALRSLYNARATANAKIQNLSFVLIGVATPSDLISDPWPLPTRANSLTHWLARPSSVSKAKRIATSNMCRIG